ncbi:hypothetical protein HDR59_02535 [bacterium]|nr:hypothetical protein [bacterium]
MAQAGDDEEEFYDDEEYDEEFDDVGDEYDEGSDLYENTVDIDDPNGMYKLDDATAAMFNQITSMERQNAIMKLKIEQGKLKLDLEKQQAEKKKLILQQEDEDRTRKIKLEEQDRKAEEARRKAETERQQQDIEAQKKKQEAELNLKISEAISSANLSNPDDVAKLNQLLVLSGGNAESLKQANSKQKTSVEDKYTIKSIVGAGGNLIANVENVEKKSTIKLSTGSLLDGWLVESIKSSSILLQKDGVKKVMYLNQ